MDPNQAGENSWMLSAKGQQVHLQDMLSHGSGGWVFRGVSPGYGEVAVKVYMAPLEEQGATEIASLQDTAVTREMAALRVLQHPNVVRLLWGFAGDKRRPHKAPFLVLELLGSSLGSLLYSTEQPLPLGQALKVGLCCVGHDGKVCAYLLCTCMLHHHSSMRKRMNTDACMQHLPLHTPSPEQLLIR